MKFGDNLKKVRKMRKISQEELADKLGVSRQSVSKWETGENYPSMTNIMCLCTIFKCNINELVHEDMSDINSLDEDVRMSVVKFKKEKQKKVKVLSKIIEIVAKIGSICCIVGISLIVLIAIIMPRLINNITVVDNKINIDGEVIKVIEDEALVLQIKDARILAISNSNTITIVKDVIIKNIDNKALLIGYVEIGLISLIVSLYLTILLFNHLEKLFKNINSGDTPFTLENVEHIKKMANLMIFLIIFPNLGGVMFELVLQRDLNVDFEMFSILEILIIFTVSYIFEYGYEIQLDSKGKMYGDESE